MFSFLKIQSDGLSSDFVSGIYQAFRASLPVDENVSFREFSRWRQWWTDAGLAEHRPETPSTLQGALKLASSDLYPSVRTCLAILTVMPVSTATAEKSFSIMQRVKIYLRSTMVTERLSGLGVLNLYREKELDPDRIVDIFANNQNRRLALLFKDEHCNQ